MDAKSDISIDSSSMFLRYVGDILLTAYFPMVRHAIDSHAYVKSGLKCVNKTIS